MHTSWVLNSIGALVCHQIAERSFEIDGQTLPLCARCTGVYAGFALGVFSLILTRNPGGQWSRARAWTLATIAIIFVFGLQGVGERCGLWHSGNEIRVMLGLLAGGAINLLLTPLAAHFLELKGKSGTNPWVYWLICVLLSSLFWVLRRNSSVLGVLSFASIVGLGLLFAFLNAAIVSAVMRASGRRDLVPNRHYIALCVLSLFGAEWLALRFVL